MSIADDLNRISAAQIVGGGDAFDQYLQRKRQLEDENRRRSQFLTDEARHRAEHVSDDERNFAQAKELQSERYKDELALKQRLDRNSARLLLEKKAAEYRVPVTNADGSRRTETEILADIDAKAGSSAKALGNQIQSLQGKLNSFSENPNISALQRQALQSIATDPAIVGKLPQDIATKLKFVADTNGDLGMLLSRMREGTLWGMNSNKYADAIEMAYTTALGNLAAASKDESLRKYAVTAKGILDQIKPLAEAQARHFSDMTSAGVSDYLGSAAQAPAPAKPTADSRGLVLPSSGGQAVASVTGPANPISAFPAPETFTSREAIANLTGDISNLEQKRDDLLARIKSGGTMTYLPMIPPSMPYMDPNPRGQFMPYSNSDLAAFSKQGRELEAQLAQKKNQLASLQSNLDGLTKSESSPASFSASSNRAQQIFGTTDFTVTPQDREDIIALGRSKGMSLQDLAYLQEAAQNPASPRETKIAVLRKIFALRDEARKQRNLSLFAEPEPAPVAVPPELSPSE